MIKLIISFVASLCIVMPAAALAVDETTTSGVQNEVKEEMQEMKTGAQQEVKDFKKDTQVEIHSLKKDVKTEVQGVKENIRTELKDKKANTVTNLKAVAEQKREDFKALAEQKRVEFEKMKEAKRGEVKGKVEAARTQLRERLEKVKDEQKRAVVERIDNQLTELNKRQMDHFSNALNQLDKILVKINERVEDAAAKGRDVTSVRTAIESAKTAIAAARASIVAQSGKVYTIAITTEAKLGTDVGKTRQLVHADIVGVREKVKAAREAVHKAVTALAQAYRNTSIEESNQPTAPTVSTTP